MTDADLRSRLAALRPPAPGEPAASRALFRATLALASAPATRPASASSSNSPEAPPTPVFFRRLVGALALPALAALLLLPLLRDTPSPAPASSPASASRELLAELETLFPGQLDAVVERDGVIQLELAAEPAHPAPADQAILVELSRGARHLRILSYSGRSIRLRLDHEELRFSPLLTGSGQVLLAGEDFAWRPSTADAPGALAGWRITARPLATVL